MSVRNKTKPRIASRLKWFDTPCWNFHLSSNDRIYVKCDEWGGTKFSIPIDHSYTNIILQVEQVLLTSGLDVLPHYTTRHVWKGGRKVTQFSIMTNRAGKPVINKDIS